MIKRPDGHHRASKSGESLEEQLGASHSAGTACRASRLPFCAGPILSPSLSDVSQLGGKCWLRLTGDTMTTVKSKQGILLQKNLIKQSSRQPLFLKLCIHCSQKKKEKRKNQHILNTILSFMSIKFYLQKIKQFVFCFFIMHFYASRSLLV